LKLSKKYKQKIKKRILNTLASIALVTTTLAAIKLADFSMPLNKELITSNENYQEKIANGPRLENTETTTYIYDAQDLVAFRNEVNAGDSYIGKTVYLMADIDMSSVCSETVGSWKPIGTYVNDAGNTVWFSGIFEGNYHTISNLYASSSEHLYLGLFTVIKTTATIQNVNMKNVYVYNTYNNGNNYAAAIAGANNGIIQNCSINGGSISNKHTKIGTSTSVNVSGVGGITGANNLGTIRNSYNNATVLATSNTSSSYANARAGGIAGHSTGAGNIINCYNKAKIEAKGYTFSAGGIVGSNFGDATVKNCYNYGTVTGTGNGTKYIGGIVGRNAAGYTGEITTGVIKNSYCTTGTTYSYYYYSGGYKTSTANRVAADKLKEYTSTLGDAFEDDKNIINSGYPVLKWENELKQNSNTQ